MLTLDLRKRLGVLSLYHKERKLQFKKIKLNEKSLRGKPGTGPRISPEFPHPPSPDLLRSWDYAETEVKIFEE